MRHKMADFQPFATPIPEMDRARIFSECRAMIEELPFLVSSTALKLYTKIWPQCKIAPCLRSYHIL